MNMAMPSGVKIDHARVMVVDDHDPIRKAIKRILQKMGIKRVVECFDGNDAIQELGRQSIDLVLCDLYMRKVDGFQVLTQLRGRSIAADIPFIVVTGEASKEDIVKASDLGANDYILKPFQVESIEQKVRQVLTNFFAPSPLLQALRLGDRCVLSQDYDKALIAYTSACEIDASSQRAKHSKAIVYERLGLWDQALGLLKRNIEEASSYYKNYATLADIYLKQKDLSKAAMAMTRELELNPKQSDRQVFLAKLLFKQSDYLGAVTHYRAALKENQRLKEALLGMGHAFAKIGDLEKSLYYFKRLRKHHPQETTALQAVIKYCVQAQDPKKAENFLRDEKRAHPDRMDTHLALVHLFLHLKQQAAALEALDELFKVDPHNKEGLRMKARIHMQQKNFMAACKTYERMLEKEPSATIYVALAECLRMMERPRESTQALLNAFSLAPRHPSIYMALTETFRRIDAPLKAYLMAARAQACGAQDAALLKTLAELFLNIKRHRIR